MEYILSLMTILRYVIYSIYNLFIDTIVVNNVTGYNEWSAANSN
jgi:hypothetical protein